MRFRDHQRVFVRRNDTGVSVMAMGTVVRLLRSSPGAWVALDERIERNNVHPFPAGDSAGRGAHVMAMPDDCNAVD